MDLYGFMIDSAVVDEITDRILIVHSHAEYDGTPFDKCETTIKCAIEEVLQQHGILVIDTKRILTNLEKEDI